MQVWRWENKETLTGPYNPAVWPDLFELLDSTQGDHEGHPDPMDEGLIMEVFAGFKFGTTSRDALDEWFEGVPRKPFAEAGFVLREYDVPNKFASVGVSRRQVAYNPLMARLVMEEPLA